MTMLADAPSVTSLELPVFGPVERTASDTVLQLAEIARQTRRRDALMIGKAGQGHIGGDYSVMDILVTLYFSVMNVDPANPNDPKRDRLILSKGHAAGALYTVLAARGFINPEQLSTFMEPESLLSGHPNRNKVSGVEANTGPLGHGLPIAVGMALAGKLDGSPRRVFVITGDGELEEGSNWEAMMPAAHYGLDNLVIVADCNGLQQGARVADTSGLEPLAAKARAFGMRVIEVDGHDFNSLLQVFTTPPVPGQPTFVIAHTQKGYPISFMRNVVAWHHRVPNAEQLVQILKELEPQL